MIRYTMTVPELAGRELMNSALKPRATTPLLLRKTTFMELEEEWKVAKLLLHTVPIYDDPS